GSLLRAVAYDSPVLAIRARTRRLKPACLVMIVSRVPSADPPAIAAAGTRSTNDAPGREVGLPLPPSGDPAGAGRRRLGADGRRLSRYPAAARPRDPARPRATFPRKRIS